MAENQLQYPLDLAIAETREKQTRNLAGITIQTNKPAANSTKEILHRLSVNPITGFPILMVILYFGVYKFVGEFGAGELVDRIEGFFEGQINPIVNQIVAQILPWQPLQDLIGNDLRHHYFRYSLCYCHCFTCSSYLLPDVFPLRRQWLSAQNVFNARSSL